MGSLEAGGLLVASNIVAYLIDLVAFYGGRDSLEHCSLV